MTDNLPEVTKKRKRNSNQYRKKEEEPTECEICNAKFTTKRSYQRHYKSIHELRNLEDCDECGKQLKGSLLLHKKSVHLNIKYSCTQCPMEYKMKQTLNAHIKKEHWFHCEGCKLSFEHKPEFDSHIQTEHIAKYC